MQLEEIDFENASKIEWNMGARIDYIEVSYSARIIAISAGRKILFFDEWGTELWREEVKDIPRPLAFSPDGKQLLTIIGNQLIYYSLPKRKFQTLARNTRIDCIRFLPDGKTFLTG